MRTDIFSFHQVSILPLMSISYIRISLVFCEKITHDCKIRSKTINLLALIESKTMLDKYVYFL